MGLRKILIPSLLISSIVLFSTAVFPGGAALAADDRLISLNKPVTASSYVEPYCPERVVDGSIDPADRWYSCGEEDLRWLQIDLEDNYTITRYIMKHMGAAGWNIDSHAADFRLEYSADGIDDWITSDDVDDSIDAVTDRNVAPFTARYVRMCFDQGNQTNDLWVSVMDWELYGVLAAPDAPHSVTASPGDRQAVLKWAGTGKAKTSYDVYISETEQGPYVLLENNLKRYQYTIKDLENSKTYYFTVQARNAAGTSGHSVPTSCTPAPDVRSIKATHPSKLLYQVGEEFDPSGMVVTAYFTDKTSKEVTGAAHITGFSSERPGKKKITVTYGGEKTFFWIKIDQDQQTDQ